MSWLRKVSPADYVTLINGVLGFLAITYIIDGKPREAILLILVAIVADGLDGYVARRYGSRHDKGHYLDSFSDTISFCFAPAILMYSMFYDASRGSAWTDPLNAVTVAASTLIATFGIVRLARFVEGDHERPTFLGLPTPANAFFLVQVFLMFGVGGLVAEEPYLVLGLSFASSFLMVSAVPYPRSAGRLWVAVAVGLGIAFVAVASLLMNVAGGVPYALVVASFSLSVLYVLGGPLYARNRGSREDVLQLHRG